MKNVLSLILSLFLATTTIALDRQVKTEQSTDKSQPVQDRTATHTNPITVYGTARAVEWSPTENILAVAGSNGIWFFNEAYHLANHIETGGIKTISWSSDGTKIAATAAVFEPEYIQSIYVWQVTNGMVIFEQELDLEGNNPLMAAIEWQPNGNLIATGTMRAEAFVWDTLTGETIFDVPARDVGSSVFYPRITGICWTEDSESLYIASNHDIATLEIDTLSYSLK